MMKTPNHWSLLRQLGIRYGHEVTLGDANNVMVRMMEYKGRKFATAREIYLFATAELKLSQAMAEQEVA